MPQLLNFEIIKLPWWRRPKISMVGALACVLQRRHHPTGRDFQIICDVLVYQFECHGWYIFQSKKWTPSPHTPQLPQRYILLLIFPFKMAPITSAKLKWFSKKNYQKLPKTSLYFLVRRYTPSMAWISLHAMNILVY